jgi:molecular chaperone Hsp33
MGELHRFMFEGLPVRGQLVRLGASWRDMLARRGDKPLAPTVRQLLGEMAAAGVLMQSNIKFNGALLLQVYGDGPVKLAVAEVQGDLSFRATATVVGEVPPGARLEAMLNVHGQGRCSITLDPSDRLPGQQPYQGVVPLHGDRREPLQQLSQVLEHYMLQSEQLDTRLVLAADAQMAAGLLIQRMPAEGAGRVSGERNEDQIGRNEDFNRIAHLTATLTRDELLTLDADTLLRRLFWQERLLRYAPRRPRFACSCGRERVRNMLRGLGADEVRSIIVERGEVEVGCEFCGQQYRFDAVDVGEMFTPARDQPHTSAPLQ